MDFNMISYINNQFPDLPLYYTYYMEPLEPYHNIFPSTSIDHPYFISNDLMGFPYPEPLLPNQALPGDHDQVVMPATDSVLVTAMPLRGHDEVPMLQPSFRAFAERMTQALCLLKGKFLSGTLVQVWTPEWKRGKYVLNAYDRPYLVDEELTGYREASEYFTFATDDSPGSFPDLPGRVFISRMPEWTSDVAHCFQTDFARVNHALHYNVRGSLALPVFDSHDGSCAAVVEVATTARKANFDKEITYISHAIEAVGFKTITIPAHPSPHVSEDDFKDRQMSSNSSVMGMIGDQYFDGGADQPSSSSVTISSHEKYRSMMNDCASTLKLFQ